MKVIKIILYMYRNKNFEIFKKRKKKLNSIIYLIRDYYFHIDASLRK